MADAPSYKLRGLTVSCFSKVRVHLAGQDAAGVHGLDRGQRYSRVALEDRLLLLKYKESIQGHLFLFE